MVGLLRQAQVDIGSLEDQVLKDRKHTIGRRRLNLQTLGSAHPTDATSSKSSRSKNNQLYPILGMLRPWNQDSIHVRLPYSQAKRAEHQVVPIVLQRLAQEQGLARNRLLALGQLDDLQRMIPCLMDLNLASQSCRSNSPQSRVQHRRRSQQRLLNRLLLVLVLVQAKVQRRLMRWELVKRQRTATV